MTDQLSLARAALRLRLTYHQVRSLVLRGALEGGQDDSGRFYVDSADLDRYVKEVLTPPEKPRRGSRRASGGR